MTLKPIIESVPPIGKLPGSREAEEALSRWEGKGAEIVTFGSSFTGNPIRGAVMGEGGRTLLAWGYPHADEPLGCAALIHLGDRWLDGDIVGGWRIVLIPVADVDGAARQKWLRDPSVKAFVEGSWRPSNLGFDLDYTHTVDLPYWKRFEGALGACASLSECSMGCDSAVDCAFTGSQPPPRPESKAIRTAFEMFQPDLAATMHNAHATGDYTYLLKRESRDVMREMVQIPERVGSLRHLGDRNDPGKRWTRDPDLLKDFGEEWAKAKMRKIGWEPGKWVDGNAPVALLCDTEFDCQLITPESPLFKGPFNDTSLTGSTEQILEKVEITNGRPYRWRSCLIGGGWKVFDQCPADGKPGERLLTIPATRSLLGMKAWHARAAAFREETAIWKSMIIPDSLLDHPWVIDRSRRKMDNTGARKIFMLAAGYRKTATVAQQATFEISWPIQTALRYAGMISFLRDEKPEGWEEPLEQILKLQGQVLPGNTENADFQASVRSQLARVLFLMGQP